jgi:transposase InsO family protein
MVRDGLRRLRHRRSRATDCRLAHLDIHEDPVRSQCVGSSDLAEKKPDNKSLVHHSDHGSQFLSIKYTERLAEAEIDLSVGTVGDADDNALAEFVIGLFKTEVINQIGPWKSMREVEWEALNWVDWDNNRRLLGPIGYIPPAEAEEAFYANLNTIEMVA